jgi:hypothetical protein
MGLAGRRYQFEASETLELGSWQIVESVGPLAIAEPVLFEDILGPLSPSSRFYRVITDLP